MLNFNCDNLNKTIKEIGTLPSHSTFPENTKESKVKNFKKQEELSTEQTLKLRPIRLNLPEVVFTNTELSKTISKFGEVSCGSCNSRARLLPVLTAYSFLAQT